MANTCFVPLHYYFVTVHNVITPPQSTKALCTQPAASPGQKVVLIDDLVATGGTIEAAAKMVERLGGEVVKIVFLMELAGLKGRERLKEYDVESVICYEGK